MQRNPLSACRAILLGLTIFGLTGCADMNTSPWASQKQTSPSPSVASSQAIDDVNTPILPTQKSKVALLLPLTGKGSDTGLAMMNAAQLAMFDLNASSVFELRPEDTGRGATEAINNAMTGGANFILGPVFSTDTKSVTPLALQSGINIVSFSTDTTAAVGNTFLMGFMPQAQVNTVLSYANSIGLKRVAVIAPRDAYGDSVANAALMFMQRNGLGNSGVIRYATNSLPNASDFAQFKSDIDAVLIAGSATESHKISVSLELAGYPMSKVKRLGTGLWDQPDAAKLSGLQGAWYAASSPRLRIRFEQRYFETYGMQPPRLASLAYDATALAVVLAKSGNGFGRAALTNPNGFSGIDGIFRFNSEGMADRGLAILEIGNGSASVIVDAPQRFTGF